MKIIKVNEDLEDKIENFRETCFGIVERNNKIICLKEKYNNSLIGGGMEVGESYEDTLKREFIEEVGFTIESIEKLCTVDCNWITKDNVIMKSLSHIFVVKVSDKGRNPLEDSEIIEIPIMEAVNELVLPYHKIGIEEYLKTKDYYFYENIDIEGIKTNIIEPSKNIEMVIIYYHGLGSNKEMVNRFYKKLARKNNVVISFDAPGHGNDSHTFEESSINDCINYLDKIIKYAESKYKKEVVLFGSSFGGYVILNYLLDNNYKTILMCPAFNFGEIVTTKMNINSSSFENGSVHLYGNIDITEENYKEYLRRDELVLNKEYKNINIIGASKDTTVEPDKLEKFCKKNNIKVKMIEHANHEMHENNKEIIEFILENI